MTFNFIDALLIFVILLGVFVGWNRGFIVGLLDLIRWVGGVLAGLCFYRTAADWLDSTTGWDAVWNQPLAFLLVVAATGLIVGFAGNLFLKRLSPDIHRHRINRILGALPGFANGLITATLLSTLLFSLPLSDDFPENLSASRTADALAVYGEEIENALGPIFNPAAQRTLNRLIVEPQSTERVELPFKVESPRPRPDLEAEMLELVNRERAANGIKPLAADPEMTEIARKHSADMFARGYFSHFTPENKSPFDRMREDAARYTIAGENLALAPTLSIAHTGLMNSPGHRANILRPQFGRVGIGVLDGGRRGLMISQEFRN
ncbi:MAG TPA: CvpA family protein [Pyrinomonadaceae bacterium]|nr:CvpA family protein [Pyrinomonadaceae bacterium]